MTKHLKAMVQFHTICFGKGYKVRKGDLNSS